MSDATLSTSSKRSCSYRLCVNPRPVRAIAESVSAHRRTSDAATADSSTARNLIACEREAERRLQAGDRIGGAEGAVVPHGEGVDRELALGAGWDRGHLEPR